MAVDISPARLTSPSRELFLRRLHSLSGIFPLGLFLIVHLGIKARSMAGEAAFQRAAAGVRGLPLWSAVELLGIVVPLAFHSLYGIKLAFDPSPGARRRYAYEGLYRAERVSGFAAFLFIAYHLWDLWIPEVLGRIEPAAFYDLLATRLSSTVMGVPLVATIYLLGVTAVAFHLTNGLVALSRSSALGRPRRRALSGLCILLGAGAWLLGVSTVVYFATGLRWSALGPSTSDPAPWCAVLDRAGNPPAVPARRAAPAGSNDHPVP